MPKFDPQMLVWLLMVIQTAGLAAAWLVRWAAETRTPGILHGMFYALFCMAGVINVLSLTVSATLWLVSSTMLAVMLLSATLDLGHTHRATVS